jgi:hypothetical protein
MDNTGGDSLVCELEVTHQIRDVHELAFGY